MNEESNNIFGRHRNLIFGFAVVILILNIALFVLVPQQTPIEINETVTEYAADDESFAVEHTLQLTGTLTKSMIAKNTFEGTIWMSGVDGLDTPLAMHLTREDGRWSGYFTDEHGQPTGASSDLAEINAGKNFDDIVIIFWDTREQKEDGGISASFDAATAHFAAVGAANRRVALTLFRSYYPVTIDK